MALHQYAEGLRRGVERSERLSSVNDAAEWIERITEMNFSRAVQIVDWTHASEHVWGIGKAVFGEGTQETQTWVNTQLDELWLGAVQKVITTLETLQVPSESGKEAVRQAVVYFRNQEPRMHYAEYRVAGYPMGVELSRAPPTPWSSTGCAVLDADGNVTMLKPCSPV